MPRLRRRHFIIVWRMVLTVHQNSSFPPTLYSNHWEWASYPEAAFLSLPSAAMGHHVTSSSPWNRSKRDVPGPGQGGQEGYILHLHFPHPKVRCRGLQGCKGLPQKEGDWFPASPCGIESPTNKEHQQRTKKIIFYILCSASM